MKKSKRIFAMLLTVLVVLIGCGTKTPPVVTDKQPEAAVQKGPITVASMIDSEGAILGNMIIQMLEKNGFSVNDRTELGTPDILRKALEGGEVDLVVDYTGSGQYYHEGQDTSVWSDAQKGYELTRKLDKEAKNLIWLTPAPANNTEMLALKRDFAQANGIASMEDFARYVNSGEPVKLICSATFAENPKGLVGYEEAYGFKLKQNQLVTLSSGNTAEMLKALAEGQDGINVSLVYGTDGSLEQMDMIVIQDPKSIPPVYLPTPVLRGEMHDKYPEIESILKPVFESLTLETLQMLNSKVAFEGQSAKAVAVEYLNGKGFLK